MCCYRRGISNTIKENPKPSRHISSYNFAWIIKYYSFLESSDQYPEHSAAGFPVFRFNSVQELVFPMYCATLSSGVLCATSPHKASHRAASKKERRKRSNFIIKLSSHSTPWVKSWIKKAFKCTKCDNSFSSSNDLNKYKRTPPTVEKLWVRIVWHELIRIWWIEETWRDHTGETV